MSEEHNFSKMTKDELANFVLFEGLEVELDLSQRVTDLRKIVEAVYELSLEGEPDPTEPKAAPEGSEVVLTNPDGTMRRVRNKKTGHEFEFTEAMQEHVDNGLVEFID